MYGEVGFVLPYDSLHICLHCAIALLLGTVPSEIGGISLLSVENIARKGQSEDRGKSQGSSRFGTCDFH